MNQQERNKSPEIPQHLRAEGKDVEKNGEFIKFSRELVRFLRVWDAMEGEERNIIDFDLALGNLTINEFREHIINDPTKKERQRILEGLENFQEELVEFARPSSDVKVLQLEFLEAKLAAHVAYCKRKLGVEIDPLEYIESTMGIKPELIPNEDICFQKETLRHLLSALGCRSYSKEAIEQFRQDRILSESSIAGHISHNSDVFLKAISDFLGIEIKPRFGIKEVKEDKYWFNWACGMRNKFILKVNTHPRHLNRWTKGKAELMSSHEITGHFGQMSGWQQAIDRKELSPALGLTSVHDPEQVTTEGIAMTLPYYVPEIEELFTPEGRVEMETDGLRMMVYNNIHIWANRGEKTEEELIRYMHKYYPAESEDEIRKQIKDRTTNPLMQVYMYSYGIGFYRHRLYAQNLNVDEKRELLKIIYRQPITPAQEQRIVEHLLANRKTRKVKTEKPTRDINEIDKLESFSYTLPRGAN
jgi:hypothetical protein